MILNLCEIWGFHGSEVSRRGLLGCGAVQNPFIWRQHGLQKRRYPTATYGITTQNTTTWIRNLRSYQ